jgi:uncharacterized protein YdaU (DUF1376 family)
MLGGTTVIEQVSHKSSNDMTLFFNRDDVKIVNCRCLQEREFLRYITDKIKIDKNDRRANSTQTQATQETASIELHSIQQSGDASMVVAAPVIAGIEQNSQSIPAHAYVRTDYHPF